MGMLGVVVENKWVPVIKSSLFDMTVVYCLSTKAGLIFPALLLYVFSELLFFPASKSLFCSSLTSYSYPSGFIPVCSLGLAQVGRMNLGKDASTFKFYTMCGLQEGFEPFAVNMNREVTMWFSKRLPTFVNVPKNHNHIAVR